MAGLRGDVFEVLSPRAEISGRFEGASKILDAASDDLERLGSFKIRPLPDHHLAAAGIQPAERALEGHRPGESEGVANEIFEAVVLSGAYASCCRA